MICALLATLMLLSLSACGKKKEAAVPSPTATAVFAPAPTQSAAATPKPAASPEASVMPTPTFTPIETPAPILRAKATTAPAADAPSSAASPAPSATPAVSAFAPVITKQPSGEGHNAGESAVFITYADKWTSLAWTAVSPSGREVDLKTFRETFPDSTVTGDNDTTLTVTNLNIDMSGWSFYCTFSNEDASTKTNSARLKVTAVPGTRTTASGETVNTRLFLCPHCGEEVFRNMITCPYCGGGIYDSDKDYYVFMDEGGNIFYMDPTGFMFYDNSDRTTTFEDTNSNYAIFDANGKPTFGNYQKEQQDLEDHWLLVEMGLYP